MYKFKIVATLENEEHVMATQTTEWLEMNDAQRDFLESSFLTWLAGLPAEARTTFGASPKQGSQIT
jgi:hypothetical protein